MPTVVNLGSLNVDHVYRIDHIVHPGETTTSSALTRGPGGKGFNQSIALARAGARVAHAGCLGQEASWLRDLLETENIDTSRLEMVDDSPGHAIIQVAASGENAILLHAGANHAFPSSALPAVLAGFGPGDWFLTQNETSAVPEALAAAHAAGLTVCLNPAPMDPGVLKYPLDLVDWLIVNEHEGADLTGADTPDAILAALRTRYPHSYVVLTLGADGVWCTDPAGEVTKVCSPRVQAVDTTAAGDTFIGFLLASVIAGRQLAPALELASRAAALSVTRHGAADSIPTLAEIEALQSP